ncbi:ERF family protein [Facklamia sp. P9177]|uniref:ERF family protein n=1 Tax=Facklamia sp. P9177 TaxID=3421945 RepID=UPI003D180DF1
MRFSESTKNIFKALSEFKKEFKQPLKDADNPFFKSKYVPLENVVQSIDNVAHNHGLAYVQSTITNEQGQAGVTTIITHSSGEFIEFDPLYLKADKPTAQGMGSAITYARRYSLSSAFGIASDVDDDGNEASQSIGHNKKEKERFNKAQKPTLEETIKRADQLRTSIQNIKKVSRQQIDEWIFEYLKVKSTEEITPDMWNKVVPWLIKLEAKAKSDEKKQKEEQEVVNWGGN